MWQYFRNLYSTFQSPWVDLPGRPQDIGRSYQSLPSVNNESFILSLSLQKISLFQERMYNSSVFSYLNKILFCFVVIVALKL